MQAMLPSACGATGLALTAAGAGSPTGRDDTASQGFALRDDEGSGGFVPVDLPSKRPAIRSGVLPRAGHAAVRLIVTVLRPAPLAA